MVSPTLIDHMILLELIDLEYNVAFIKNRKKAKSKTQSPSQESVANHLHTYHWLGDSLRI